MIPNKFEYERASSVDEAIQCLVDYGDDAKILAGGHSLLPAMKLRLNNPLKLVDINRIPALKYINEENGMICIGSATTHHDVEISEFIIEKLPMLSQVAESIGDMQVRNFGTLGGSLAHADPAADWPAAMLAAEAIIVLKGPSGLREIEASSFFLGLYTTALQDDELIVEIKIPIPQGNVGSAYVKCLQPASRFAIVGCAAMITKSNGLCDKVKLAFTGVSTSAFCDELVEQSLVGHAPDESNITLAIEKAAENVETLNDHFASSEYRRHLAKVYAKKALMAAANSF